jgi:hypothetical protein
MLITASAIESETNQIDNNLLIALNASLQTAEIFLINTANTNPTWLKTIRRCWTIQQVKLCFVKNAG